MSMTEYSECRICPRNCGVDRNNGGLGVCGMPSELYLARAALHFWEEPCISGDKGSGTVFFSGCNLRCVYCQNRNIAVGDIGMSVDTGRLSEIFYELKERGANNINLVTPTHYIPHIVRCIDKVKSEGFDLPFVYNTSSYENVDSLKMLDGLIDIFLPDYKYALSPDAKKYSRANDYPKVAFDAIKEMKRQVPECITEKGVMKKGIIIRHLLLPGKVIASKIALKRMYDTFGNEVYYSIMNQYTPLSHVKDYPELNRRVNEAEYKSLCDYALALGIENAYVQSGEAVGESFIPDFNFEGVIR